VTSDPDFKVTLFFDIECLRNDTRQSHSYLGADFGFEVPGKVQMD